MLVAEATLYKAEGLRVGDITFESNAGCVELLVRGIVPILDEQTVVANGSDARLLTEVYQKHKASPFLLLPHAKQRHSTFIVRHFAEDGEDRAAVCLAR